MVPRRFISVEDYDDVIVVTFTQQKLLGDDVDKAGQQLFELVDSLGHKKIVVSFRGVEAIDSSFTGKMITLFKKMRGVGGRLVLCCMDPLIYEVYEVMKLHLLFTIIKSEDGDEAQALRKF